MNKLYHTFVSAIIIFATVSCGSEDSGFTPVVEPELIEKTWEFDTVDDWQYFHQDTATVIQWRIDDGKLALSTRANTYDRTKMHTADGDYAEGVYKWRTFIPEIAPGDQVSIGSWIYCDDHHELDFEVGYGTAAARSQAGAKDGELVACMTNQDLPFKSGYTAISPGWHDFEIRLEVRKSGCYNAIWKIDGGQKQILELKFGPEVGFLIHCSVENLKFLGDHIATSDYTALFDLVSFKGYKAYKH